MQRTTRIFTRALGLLAFTLAAAATAGGTACDQAKGEKIFQNCAVCHTNDDSGAHGAVGPNLHGLLGRKVGQVPGYKFSSSLRKSGDIWSLEHMDKFLENPMAMYPRTRMAFAGLKKDQDRNDVICFLNKSTD